MIEGRETGIGMSEAGYLVQDLKGVCLNLKPYLEAVSEIPKQEAGEEAFP